MKLGNELKQKGLSLRDVSNWCSSSIQGFDKDDEISPETIRSILNQHIGRRNTVKGFHFGNKTKSKKKKPKSKIKRTYKITKIHENRMCKFLYTHRGLIRVTARVIKERFKLNCSDQLVRNVLRKHHVTWLVRRKNTWYSKLDLQKRLRYAKKMLRNLSKDENFFRRLVFIDGSTFYLPMSNIQLRNAAREAIGSQVWRTKSEGLNNDCIGKKKYSQGASVKVWGVHGVHQKGVRKGNPYAKIWPLPQKVRKTHKVKNFCSKTGVRKKDKRVSKNINSKPMNQEIFQNDFIMEKLVPWCKDMGFVMRFGHPKSPLLIMDHERSLWTKKSLALLKQQGFTVVKTPVASPDLNPIENLWKRLKEEVYNISKFPNSLKQTSDKGSKRNYWVQKIHNSLKSVLKKQKVDLRTGKLSYEINNMGWMSFKQRMKDVIKNKGGKTRY